MQYSSVAVRDMGVDRRFSLILTIAMLPDPLLAQLGTGAPPSVRPAPGASGIVGTTTVPPEAPVTRPRVRPTTPDVDEGVAATPLTVPASNVPLGASRQTISSRLLELDVEARRGTISLEEYRERQQRILRGQ